MYLALGQVPVILGDVNENLKIMEDAIREVKTKTKEHIDLIAFPELFITGYNLKDNYNTVSEKIPSKGIAQEGMLSLSKKYNITILTGIVERGKKSLFNSAIMIGPEGYIGHCRKQYLPNFGPFEEKTFFGEGKESYIFKTSFGNIGVQICYDLFFPEISMKMAQKGADLIINLAASPTTSRPLFHRVLPARAIETTCYYGFVNNVGTQGNLVFAGESCVFDPRGKVMAEIEKFEQGTIVCQIPLENVEKYRNARPVLRDSMNKD
ncbi:MAG: carbon-nitrogen hydrolase family protein [Candidatus Poseidoniia archaeon]|nr:carbon-nitrogen hydrolase family protein [Candidatus Poseidoniia archaeon]